MVFENILPPSELVAVIDYFLTSRETQIHNDVEYILVVFLQDKWEAALSKEHEHSGTNNLVN